MDNLCVGRFLVSVTVLAACVALAACGGGGSGNSATTPAKKTPAGGVVNAEPTAGILGPAATVEAGRSTTTGPAEAPISPDEVGPTDAEKNGVAGAVACNSASASANPSSANLSSIAQTTVCLLNGERAAKGLPPLHLNGSLNKASVGMAGLMVKQQFFAHDTPDGRSVVDRIKPTGYIRGNWSLGENIAWGSGALATPRAIVNGWMHSTGHRENILRAKFKDIGIGVKLGAPQRGLSGGATYVTDFGRHG